MFHSNRFVFFEGFFFLLRDGGVFLNLALVLVLLFKEEMTIVFSLEEAEMFEEDGEEECQNGDKEGRCVGYVACGY